ncbi:MAG TPA: hypothetical protein VNL37_02815, partial [Candidatus Polarisedimenticolia bacterium]|nr:hypothetical protein [Candidatus Polarisedimenticolia bacterium]
MKVRSHRWRAGAAVAGAMVWIVSCATPSQWNSVRQQVEDIRRQVDLVQAQQQRSREAVEEWQAARPERTPAQPAVGDQDEKGSSGGPASAASPSRGATTADAQALYRRGYA